MECLTCHEKMKCIDDNSDFSPALEELLECPKCYSKAWIKYCDKGIEKVKWER